MLYGFRLLVYVKIWLPIIVSSDGIVLDKLNFRKSWELCSMNFRENILCLDRKKFVVWAIWDGIGNTLYSLDCMVD